MSDAAEIQAVLFKQVGDRFVFQAPNPWVFGSKNRYLVTETQKQELMAIVTPRRPLLRIAIITAGILLWTVAAATIVWAVSPHEDPRALDALAMFVLIVVPIFGALIVALQRNLRRMQPILAGAPRTEERITHTELRQAMTKAISLRRSLILGAVWTGIGLLQVFNLVIRNARHPLFSDVQSYLNAFTLIMAVGLAAYYLVLAIRKLRQKEVAA